MSQFKNNKLHQLEKGINKQITELKKNIVNFFFFII